MKEPLEEGFQMAYKIKLWKGLFWHKDHIREWRADETSWDFIIQEKSQNLLWRGGSRDRERKKGRISLEEVNQRPSQSHTVRGKRKNIYFKYLWISCPIGG